MLAIQTTGNRLGSSSQGGIHTGSMSAGSSASASSLVTEALPVSPRIVSGANHAHLQSPAATTHRATPSRSAASAVSSTSTLPLPASILISDPIHGQFKITEGVLIDLLRSKPVQRLHKVLQHGITGLIGMTPSPPVTRYDHSVGAMLLVRKARGTVEAQAAALLHDIAHTALSHVVDGAFGYVLHEVDKREYLDTTAIPAILRKHGLEPDYILEESNFPLLELDSPQICADRLDYAMRDGYAFKLLTLEDARCISNDLCDRNGRFCLRSVKLAKRLAEAYLASDEFAWSNPNHSIMYSYAADTIRAAVSKGAMVKADLWREDGDDIFWKGMTQHRDPEIRALASRVKSSTKVEEIPASEYKEGDEDYYYKETAKIRTIDPDVLQSDGTVVKLTLLSEEYRLTREAYIKRKSGVHCYRPSY